MEMNEIEKKLDAIIGEQAPWLQSYILKDGVVEPCSFFAGLMWNSKVENKKIENTQIGDAEISTVFLGMDLGGRHGVDDTSRFFETMVFGGKFNGLNRRYETLEEAKAGHWKIVKKVRKND